MDLSQPHYVQSAGMLAAGVALLVDEKYEISKKSGFSGRWYGHPISACHEGESKGNAACC